MDIPRRLGPGQPCLVIAEAGVNHNGDMALAHRLIEAAAGTGADAVKFQAFVTEELVATDAAKAAYQTETTGAGTQFAMLKALELSGAQQAELKAHCDEIGLAYLCTPYDFPSIDLLDRLGVNGFKVSSGDLDNVPFLRHMAAKGRPVLLSTGMADLAEVETGFAALKGVWTALLHCTSEYPAPAEQANLRAIGTLRQAFRVPVGFSDHTEGVGVAPLAVAAGAVIVEKHFTLDRAMAGPDHRASLDPDGFKALVVAIRQAEAILGDGVKRPAPCEAGNKALVRKSLVARRAIEAGEVIAADALACKRPGDGLAPSFFDQVVGKKAARAIPAGKRLEKDDVAW